MSESTKGKKQKEPTYLEAFTEIEAILEQLERADGVDIDELAGKVERAATLIRFCNGRLKEAGARVRKVTEELAQVADEDDDASESAEMED